MKKSLLLLMVFVVFASFSSSAFAKDSSTARVKQIQELFGKKSKMVAENATQSEISIIDARLSKLGVEFLSSDEVNAKFNKKINIVSPTIAVPSGTTVSWGTYRETITRNGVSYDVQHLVAIPNSSNSSLKQSGFTSIKQNYGWAVGGMDLIKFSVKSGVSLNPIVGGALTVYDGFKSFISNLQPTQTLSNTALVYSWGCSTSVSFIYVKKTGQSDNLQQMSFASNSAAVSNGWSSTGFVNGINGGSTPVSTTGTRSITATPITFDDGGSAVSYYLNPSLPKYAWVDSVNITGIESKSAAYVYPQVPTHPGLVY